MADFPLDGFHLGPFLVQRASGVPQPVCSAASLAQDGNTLSPDQSTRTCTCDADTGALLTAALYCR